MSKAIYTFAAGSKKLYSFLNRNPALEIRSADHTNLPDSVAGNDNVVSINNTVQMDLQGQAASESSGHRHFSGTGGQLGIVRAAYQSKGGRAFLCMPSTYVKDKSGVCKSRIVTDLPSGTVVTPPRTDVMSIVTYIRSVKPVRNEVPKSIYRIPLPFGYGSPVSSVAEVSRDDKVKYGAYLAGPAGHCIECHSPMGPHGPDIENELGAGGLEFPGPWGVSVSANITPTGLKDRSDNELKTMITTGVRPDGSRMLPPMPYSYYANMSHEDLDAIITYVRTLPEK